MSSRIQNLRRIYLHWKIQHWIIQCRKNQCWKNLRFLYLRCHCLNVRVHCILPCEGQEIQWADSEQEQYNAILRQACEIVYVSQKYTADCMLRRNRYLVDHSSVLLAVYNGVKRSGTGATVNYARRLGREIIIINPLTRSVSYEGCLE